MNIFLVIILIFAIFSILVIRYFFQKNILLKSLNYVLLDITLPSGEPQPYEKVKEEIGVFEQFLATLQNYKNPIVMEIAVPHIGEEIHFYFAADRKEVDSLERSLHAFWPNANIVRTKDYNIFNISGHNIVSLAALAQHFALPIKRYKAMDSDPLSAITNVFSKLAYEGEGLALQFIFNKAPQDATKNLRSILEGLRKGTSFKELTERQTFPGILKIILETFSAKPKSQDQNQKITEQISQKPISEETIQLVNEKYSKPLLAINIRLVASAPTLERAETILDSLEHAFDQFADPRGNKINFIRKKGRSAKNSIFDFSFRIFNHSQQLILSIEECATLVHLPTSGLTTPKIQKVYSKTALAPLNLPTEGIIIGKNIFRGEERLVRILKDDRRRHIYIIGQTGTGKTALIQEMARQDIENGEGVGVIDPHGDLAESILGLIPKERIEDVIYFNPTDIERPIGLNMLEFDQNHPEQKTFVINEMIEIMDKLYDLRQVGGPMFEQYLRNAMLLIMGDPIIKPTIMEIPKVLSDATFRRKLLSRCTNPSVVTFWEKEAEKAGGEFALANMVPYITSKLNPFIANDIVRPIVGQIHSPFKLRDIMDNKKILIVNLAKGVLGETNSYLLGMIMVGKIMMAALSRVDQPESQRTDFTLYIDEFQNVTTKTLASILAEARKYRLSLVMAHQFIAQIREDIRDAIFGNVGTIIAFRVGSIDAELLEKQFIPVFSRQDLINLDNYNAYIKLLIRGQVSPPFNIKTFPPKKPDLEISQKVKQFSRLLYGKPREEVEEEIAVRIKE